MAVFRANGGELECSTRLAGEVQALRLHVDRAARSRELAQMIGASGRIVEPA
jgi:hypothetical protein